MAYLKVLGEEGIAMYCEGEELLGIATQEGDVWQISKDGGRFTMEVDDLCELLEVANAIEVARPMKRLMESKGAYEGRQKDYGDVMLYCWSHVTQLVGQWEENKKEEGVKLSLVPPKEL